jgi:hypothetical protein
MDTPPKKPDSDGINENCLIDEWQRRHWIWASPWAQAVLRDMAQKLSNAEAELAKLKGKMQ